MASRGDSLHSVETEWIAWVEEEKREGEREKDIRGSGRACSHMYDRSTRRNTCTIISNMQHETPDINRD